VLSFVPPDRSVSVAPIVVFGGRRQGCKVTRIRLAGIHVYPLYMCRYRAEGPGPDAVFLHSIQSYVFVRCFRSVLIPFGCVSRSRTFIYNFLLLCTGFCVVYILLYMYVQLRICCVLGFLPKTKNYMLKTKN